MGKAVLLSGGIGSGKTTCCLEILGIARKVGMGVGGIISPRRFSDGKLIGYDCRECRGARSFPLARRPGCQEPDGWVDFGLGYLFSRSGIKRGNRAIIWATEDPGVSLVMVDEVGRLEISGRGFSEGVKFLARRLEKLRKVAIFSCRASAHGWMQDQLSKHSVACETDLSPKADDVWGMVLRGLGQG